MRNDFPASVDAHNPVYAGGARWRKRLLCRQARPGVGGPRGARFKSGARGAPSSPQPLGPDSRLAGLPPLPTSLRNGACRTVLS